MSAEVLREAARLMRNRANAATPSPWRWAEQSHDEWVGIQDDYSALGSMFIPADAFHVTSWHPAVALAVAGWLDGLVDAMTNPDAPNSGVTTTREEARALAVACAYLGDSA